MDFAHPCDHEEVHELLNDKSCTAVSDASLALINDMLVTKHRTLFVRIKCTLTSKGRNINIKSAAYRVCVTWCSVYYVILMKYESTVVWSHCHKSLLCDTYTSPKTVDMICRYSSLTKRLLIQDWFVNFICTVLYNFKNILFSVTVRCVCCIFSVILRMHCIIQDLI